MNFHCTMEQCERDKHYNETSTGKRNIKSATKWFVSAIEEKHIIHIYTGTF